MANGTSESVTFCGPQLSTSASSPTRTVGILGFGRIAQATLAGLVAFGITHCTIRTALPYRPETTTVRDAALQAIHKLKALEHVEFSRLTRDSDVLFVLGRAETKRTISWTPYFCGR
jgi:glyoxylate/hydroxypyruvate reductase